MAHTIGVIAGDGIGKEVIPAGIAAIEKATRGTGVSVSFSDLPWSCEYYTKHGRMMDEDGYERMAKFDALYMGALGAPGVSDAASAGLILGIRQKFDQYVNLRPMRLLAGLELAARRIAAPADIDMVCVRENSEGEYSGVGGRIHRGTRARSRAAGRRVHASRHRADSALRLRDRVEAPAQDAGERDQVERADALDGVVGRGRRDRAAGLSRRRVPQVSRRRARGADDHASADARRDGDVEPVRRHPHRHRLGDLGQPRHRAGREHQSDAAAPVDVRADPRLGAGHRRARGSPIRSARSGPAR